MFESGRLCQKSKLKIFGLSPLPMQNPYSKTFLDIKLLFVNRFSIFFATHFRTKGMLTHDKINLYEGILEHSDMQKKKQKKKKKKQTKKNPSKRCCIRSSRSI